MSGVDSATLSNAEKSGDEREDDRAAPVHLARPIELTPCGGG